MESTIEKLHRISEELQTIDFNDGSLRDNRDNSVAFILRNVKGIIAECSRSQTTGYVDPTYMMEKSGKILDEVRSDRFKMHVTFEKENY